MSNPRKALEQQKGRKSAARKERASKTPPPMGSTKITIPTDVAADERAKARWVAIIAAYKTINYIPSTGDVEAIRRLCFLYSEADGIRDNIISGEAGNNPNLLISLHKLLDGKRRIINSLENVLFLNPVSRMRGLPTPPPAKEPTEAELKFANVF